MSEWIPIEKELPPEGEEVYLFDKEDGVVIGERFDSHGKEYYSNSFVSDEWFPELCSVTHWQKWIEPEPPIVEKELGL